MATIRILSTGGTISMSEDLQTHTVSPTAQPAPIDLFSDILPTYGVETSILFESFANLPSPHLTPSIMFDLTVRIRELLTRDDVDGVVVTHGTDTLEETADLLDITIDSQKPVVVTGAMRSANEIGADGPINLLGSVLTASAKSSQDRGCLVVFNDEIHAALHVTKTHTSNVATFQSPGTGPIGIIDKRGIHYRHPKVRRPVVNTQNMNARVGLIKMAAGMDGFLLNTLLDHRYQGIVIEALGLGNVPPALIPSVKRCQDLNIPIVLVSRCFSGLVQDVYGYEGGGRHLRSLGVIFSRGINGQKARIELMALLGAGYSLEKIRQWFEDEE